MRQRIATSIAAATAFCFSIEMAFMPGVSNEAFAFGHGGGHFGGGHFGGGHFGGGHFGGGHFGGGHFAGGHFGGFRGGHFGGMHFGQAHFAGRHLGGGRFAHSDFARSRIGNNHFGNDRLGADHLGASRLSERTGLNRSRSEIGRSARFEGGRQVSTRGMYRNGFGRAAAWNRWVNNGGGGGWGYGGWADSVFWPFLYGDALSFALWPYDFYDPFFSYGPNALFASIFWPGDLGLLSDAYYPFDDYGLGNLYGVQVADNNFYAYYGRRRHFRERSDMQANTEVNSVRVKACAGLAPGVLDLPIDQIQKAIQPTDAQMIMLDDLKAASAHADAILRGSCPSEPPLTPISRLDAAAQRIHAMSEAVGVLRGPLAALYLSLNQEQQDKFAAIGAESRVRRARTAKDETRNADAHCQQKPQNITLLPVQRIEETIKPTAEQKSAFDALKSASDKAAADLDASCPAQVPDLLTVRLDALAKRLDALAAALDSVKPALKNFYNSLSDEQKARFNIIGDSDHAAFAQPADSKG